MGKALGKLFKVGGGGGGGGGGGDNGMAETMRQQTRMIEELRKQNEESCRRYADEIKNSRESDGKMIDHQYAMMEQLRKQHEETLRRYEVDMKSLQKELANMQDLLQKPVQERQRKVDFVNGLRLKIRQTSSLLLLGQKGTGKSTFLWLLGRGPQPTQTFGDGTTDILHLKDYVDSIGLQGWTIEHLVKLLVLMIYEGIPKDFIIFTTDRIYFAITALGHFGICNPLIVIMSSEFWNRFNNERDFTLEQDENGIQRVVPSEKLKNIYHLEIYEQITKLNLGTPVTHHDDIQHIIDDRFNHGVAPFRSLMTELGNTFEVSMEIDPSNSVKELLFRYIYIYEKVYNRNKQDFMNDGELSDFK